MRQRDYQLLRFPHSNINISLSSLLQFSSSKVFARRGLSIIQLWQGDYPSCARFICASASFHYPFLILPPDYPCFSTRQNSFPSSPASIIISLWCLSEHYPFLLTHNHPDLYYPCVGCNNHFPHTWHKGLGGFVSRLYTNFKTLQQMGDFDHFLSFIKRIHFCLIKVLDHWS